MQESHPLFLEPWRTEIKVRLWPTSSAHGEDVRVNNPRTRAEAADEKLVPLDDNCGRETFIPLVRKGDSDRLGTIAADVFVYFFGLLRPYRDGSFFSCSSPC